MVNATTRIAVEIAHLPPFDFSWSNSTPQKPRSNLVAADILPISTDGKQMFDRATEFIMRFLTENFPALENLKEILPLAHSPSSQEKSTIVPMPIMQRDEKYTDETIKILHDFKSDCNLTGEPQVLTLLYSWGPTHRTFMSHIPIIVYIPHVSGICGGPIDVQKYQGRKEVGSR